MIEPCWPGIGTFAGIGIESETATMRVSFGCGSTISSAALELSGQEGISSGKLCFPSRGSKVVTLVSDSQDLRQVYQHLSGAKRFRFH